MNTDRHISSWDKLSLKDKADIMKMAVQKGMYNLDDIRNTYNEFAEGGPEDNIPIRYKYSTINDEFKGIKSIETEYGLIEAKTNGHDVLWFLNGKKLSPEEVDNFKYYDKSVDGYRRLGYPQWTYTPVYAGNPKAEITDVSTPLDIPYTNKFIRMVNDRPGNKSVEDQSIPWSGDIITLRTKGNMNLADVPIAMLDSIAVNSGRSNTSVKTNLGLVGKESTFGQFSKALGNEAPKDFMQNPWNLVNNHAYFVTPETDYYRAVQRKYPQMGSDDEVNIVKQEKELKKAVENNLIKEVTPHYSHYMLADAFARYAADPQKYNPGQTSYIPMVNKIAEEVWNEPQIQKWYNNRGKSEYERGKKEGMAFGGPLVQLANKYLEGGPESNNSVPWYAKAGLWLLDKVGVSDYTRGKEDDIKFRQNLYNRVDPTDQIPRDAGEVFWRFRDIVQAKNEDESEYSRHYEDPVANAGWAKRLGLPYDKAYLPENKDGSSRLPAFVETEIPTDTTFLKERIEKNRKLKERYKSPNAINYDRNRLIDAGIKADSTMLEGLRKVYNNPGSEAVVNEHSFINRNWIDNGNPTYKPSPLNIMKNYTISYDKDKNTLNYHDVYDFNEFEPFVPGNLYEINGSIKLK